ncbi:peptidase [Hahella sp. CCB-MM4]|uniref:M48 family metallopeptidase n=1 Tax=Hahella sp. (strain CCB-MM4) TaxID=1926491 RepID=UPI000B9AE190|nr:M48 family metallopeptidase [Hahella sp. CCB-MM4]OZG70942.1 peptidase [Hahella sp. CCB-MM4]
MLRRLMIPVIASTFILGGCQNGQYTQSALVIGQGVLQATTLSESQVVEASAAAAAEMDKKSKIAPASSTYAKRLANMTKGQTSINGVSLNYKVYISDQINAFAMADGTVRVYSGLMDVMPDDQVLAVMQHEIGHVALRHSYNQMRERLLTDTAFQAVGSVGGTVGELTQSQLGQLAYAAVNARFSQSDENEADAYAVRSLKGLGRDPYAMKRAIQTLQTKAGGGDGGFLSSHPSNADRLANIQKTIDRL